MGFEKIDPSVTKGLIECLWGTVELKQDVFNRWSQGLKFSDSTPAALLQHHGGPCAVLVPIQAYIVKAALFHSEHPDVEYLLNVSSQQAKDLLVEALSEILVQVTDTHDYNIVLYQPPEDQSTSQSSDPTNSLVGSVQTDHCNITQDAFHSSLVVQKYSSLSTLRAGLSTAISSLTSPFGVLTYLYSILLTKGIEQINNEVEDPSEPLIDSTYGHGSQSLINLLLTSRATTNVWDNDKELDGLKLHGVNQQAAIGFLTLLEQMRYCEVGWFLKNPKYPIWVLGSETHLTLLFSPTQTLVVRDSPQMAANSIFARFDPDGNGFIVTSILGDLMAALDLVAEKEYVDIMALKLDPEEFGIIPRHSFMEEFFPASPIEQPRDFLLYHYNGLTQSCIDGKHFLACKATLAEEMETQFITDTSPIKLCLQTKWPSIELAWPNNKPPSLN